MLATLVPGWVCLFEMPFYRMEWLFFVGMGLVLLYLFGSVHGPGLLFRAYKRWRWMRKFDWNLDGEWRRR